MARRILIIGANAAGLEAASSARKTDREAEITLVTDEPHLAYSRCGLPYVLAGEIPSFQDLIVFPPSYYKMMRLDVRAETHAVSINPRERKVELKSADGVELVDYDSLILATGANPFTPPIRGIEKRGVFTLRTLEDGMRIKEAMEDAEKAAIIGAGFIGIEMAHAFREHGIETTMVELLPHILPAALDRDMAQVAQRALEENGVRVLTGTGVEEILGGEKAEGVLAGGTRIEADIIILSTGTRPNTELARQAGAEIGPTRGIKVNPRMMTSIPDIYAAGDCAESYSLLNGQPTLSQLGTTAVRMGRVAGINAAGGYSTFPGVLSSAVTKAFEMEIGSTGLTEAQAQRLGLRAASGTVTSKTKARYYPGGRDIRVKVVAEPDSGRIIGCQIIGGEEVTQRINAASIAIQKGMTVWELAKSDTCYAPPVNETWEALALASENAARRLREQR
jgi:NADH oxidase (H2O2-forming)